ncbi:MAG: right-handed parallel beta-helix repeat-containing protein, partial [Candidatus Bipolaricaulia bacterium]
LTVCPEGPPQCDFAAIQAAIEAAVPGAFILIYPGTYRENLILDKSLSLAATESGQARIQGTQAHGTTLTIQVEGEMNILLEGLTILGLTNPAEIPRGTATYTTGIKVKGEGALNLSLIGIQIANTFGGVECSSPQISAEISLYRSRLAANGGGALACRVDEEKTATLQIKDSVFSGNGAGVHAFDNTKLIIEGSLFIRNGCAVGMEGHVMGTKGAEVVVRRSQFFNDIVSVFAQGDERGRLEIRECLFSGDRGIFIMGKLALEAYDNEFRELQYYGLRMMLGTRARLEGNTFEGNGDGIEVFSAGYLKEEEEYSLLEARGNRFVRNRGCGIRIEHVEAAMRALSIAGEGNEFSENGQDLCPPDYPWPEDFMKP